MTSPSETRLARLEAASALAQELQRLADEDDGAEIPVLLLTPEAMVCKPQVGRPLAMTWSMLAAYYSRPTIGDAKDCVGGLAFGEYRDDIRRKTSFVRTRVLSLDFDSRGVDDVAPAFAGCLAIVHETYSSEPGAGRARAFIKLDADLTEIPAYEELHRVARAHLRAAGLPPDESAKDCTRLSYSPVRRPGAGYRFRVTRGAPVDALAVIAAQPPPPPRPAHPPPPRPEHRDAYIAGAMRKASANIANASPGERHGTLCREAFALARLALSETEIAHALLPAWASVAGEARMREGEKTIVDAVRARGAA
jgi:hypothetical protein